MGSVVIAIATGATIAAGVYAVGAALYYTIKGIFYGISCIVNIVKDAFKTKVETSGKGEDMAVLAEGLNNDLKAHNIKRDKKEEIKLQNEINQIRKDKDHIYKISTTIERQDNPGIHTPEEKDYLKDINSIFKKNFTHKEEIIILSDQKNNFGDFYMNKFSKVGWEKIVELNLSNNNICNMEPIYNMQLLSLKKLDLSYNNISDIDDIDRMIIMDLKHFYLNNNKISNPFAFYNKIFNNLETLNLLDNNIEDKEKECFILRYKDKCNKNTNLVLKI